MEKKVYWIEGDGIGAEIWQVTRPVVDKALAKAYNNEHSLNWEELLAGEKALEKTGELLPQETIDILKTAEVAIKGPLGTPVGKGFRSLNVTLRQEFDLYACIRPVRYFQGIVSPLRNPEKVNMVVFRENTEDVYIGIEYAAGSSEATELTNFLKEKFNAKLNDNSAIGIKPMTEEGCKRLVRSAIRYADKHNLPSVTLVHKGNIMKYTEGALREWGYQVAREEFADITYTKGEEKKKILIQDVIADAMFQNALLYPERYSVLACPNLNGDYVSDALAAQVGGLGLAPGVNMSDSFAIFEATHGTAPDNAGKNNANPCSLLFSACLMLEHLGFNDASDLITKAFEILVEKKTLTPDLANQMENATAVGTKEFGELLLQTIDAI